MRKDYREEGCFKKGGHVGHQIHVIIEKDKSKKPRRYSKSEDNNKLDNTLYHKSSAFASPRQTLNQTNGKGRKLNTEAERIYQGKNGAQRLKEGGNVKRESHFLGLPVGMRLTRKPSQSDTNPFVKMFGSVLGGNGIGSKLIRGAIKGVAPQSKQSGLDDIFNIAQKVNNSTQQQPNPKMVQMAPNRMQNSAGLQQQNSFKPINTIQQQSTQQFQSAKLGKLIRKNRDV